jgi:hypothetical protein
MCNEAGGRPACVPSDKTAIKHDYPKEGKQIRAHSSETVDPFGPETSSLLSLPLVFLVGLSD